MVVCPSIGSFSLEHGRWRIVNGSHYEYRTRIVFTCDPGYFRLGPAHIQCLPNGTWSWKNERPRCQSESRYRAMAAEMWPILRENNKGWICRFKEAVLYLTWTRYLSLASNRVFQLYPAAICRLHPMGRRLAPRHHLAPPPSSPVTPASCWWDPTSGNACHRGSGVEPKRDV